MKTMQLGSTPLEVTRIAYGCMGIGGSWDRAPLSEPTRHEAVQAIRTALDEGINFFDHADIYCWGKSEEAFAAIWSEVPNLREKIIVQSKCGITLDNQLYEGSLTNFNFSYEHILRSVEDSLKRLQTDYIDLYMLHRDDRRVPVGPLVDALNEHRAAGRIRALGVSNWSAARL